jgi:hypothetical protein
MVTPQDILQRIDLGEGRAGRDTAWQAPGTTVGDIQSMVVRFIVSETSLPHLGTSEA